MSKPAASFHPLPSVPVADPTPGANDGHDEYPVHLVVRSPARFTRAGLLLRIAVCVAIGIALHGWSGGLLGFVYFSLPMLSAVLIASKGGGRYLAEDARWLRALLEWVLALYAYLFFVTDTLPVDPKGEDRAVQLTIHTMGQPTLAGALLRLLTGLPHLFILCVLGMVAGLLSVVAMLTVLFAARCPAGLISFQRHYVAWMARFFAYHASLVDRYAPFAFGSTSPSD